MNKTVLERFISKYALGGNIESVAWRAEGGRLSTEFATDDKNLVGRTATTLLPIEEGTYNIFDTGLLRSLLGVVGEEIALSVTSEHGRPFSVTFGDGATVVKMPLADERVIPAVPVLKTLPKPVLTAKLDQKVMTTFVRAKSALSDADVFTVFSTGTEAKLALGYVEGVNTSEVDIALAVSEGEAAEPTKYDAKYLAAIFQANKEAGEGTLTLGLLGSKALLHLSFPLEGFEVDYYLVGKR